MTEDPMRMDLVVPDDWYRLPLTDEAALQRAVEAVVERQFRGLDDQPLLRRQAAAAVLDQARAARSTGGVDMYLSWTPAAGVPLALSLVVGLVPLPPGEDSLAAMAASLDGDDARAEVVELPSGTAVRRERVGSVSTGGLGAPGEQEVLLVDYSFPGPAGTALLLSFSSPLVAIADALAGLFEAVTGTVRWTS